MLLTDILFGAILLAKSEISPNKLKRINHAKGKFRINLQEVRNMFIYDSLNYLQEEDKELGINALSYVVLDCGR